MIYKFISQAHIRSQYGYIKDIPESAIFYNIKKDDSGEVWYIMIPSKDFYNPLAINWSGKSCDFFNAVDFGEWVFLYTKGIIADTWPDVGREKFYDIFSNVFDNIYFYDRKRTLSENKSDNMSIETIDYMNYVIDNITKLMGQNNTPYPKCKVDELYRAYKLKDITADGKLEVVRVTNDKDGYTGVERMTITQNYKDIPRSFMDRHNTMVLSNDGTEFWEEFNKCLKSFTHDIEIYNK